ncbi:MAG TPA: radical SAM protein [Chitinophagales bacterium]|nr:radical SAM protein [Chitinophagales bacterium]
MNKKPRILLIGPTALDYDGQPIKQRKLHLPGLTLPMLAAVTPDEVELRLLSETVEEIPYDEDWDLVGLTGMGSGIFRAWQIADEFRKRKVKVVLGGIAASLGKPEWMLEHADCLVTGEAEETWPLVVNDFLNGNMKQQYRMQKVPDINTLPLPRYDMMNASKLGVWRPVQATRGCPFTCNFCSITAFFKQSYRKRPVDQVIRDVREAKKSGSRYIAFIDDNIGVDFNYCKELWEALIPEKIIWMSQCSLHIAERPDMLELARASGCRILSFGIESTNEKSLEFVDKEWNRPERYREAIETIRKYGIEISTEMIIGLDGDDKTVFQRTHDFIMDNRISVPRVHILTPVPGTPLYDQMEADGRIISRDFNHYSGGQVVFKPKNFSNEDLQKGYWKLYEDLFSLKSIYKRATHNLAQLEPFMRAFIVAVNFHYRKHIHHRITPGIV